ncbi:MAG: hypothetical protein Q9162_007975, partial [Coniocarpon cinnabarinum]
VHEQGSCGVYLFSPAWYQRTQYPQIQVTCTQATCTPVHTVSSLTSRQRLANVSRTRSRLAHVSPTRPRFATVFILILILFNIKIKIKIKIKKMTSEQSLHETVKAFIQSFQTLTEAAHLPLRATKCLHRFTPASVNPPSPMTNQDWALHLGKLRQVLTGIPVVAKEIHVNVAKREIFIWAEGTPGFREEVKDGLTKDGLTEDGLAKEGSLKQEKGEKREEKKEKKEKGEDREDDEWHVTTEYIFLLSIDADGKIERILEFVDSLTVERLRGLMMRAWRNAGTETVLFEGGTE